MTGIQTICVGQDKFQGPGGEYSGPPIPLNANVCVPDGVVGKWPDGYHFPRNYCGPPTVGTTNATAGGSFRFSGGCGCDC